MAGPKPAMTVEMDEINNEPTPQATLPRRPRRQPLAHGPDERSACETRARRDRCDGVKGGRGPRNREGDPQTGRDRAESRHRRRIPPRLLELRFSRCAACYQNISRRAQDQVSGRQSETDDVARYGQARSLRDASDDRAL